MCRTWHSQDAHYHSFDTQQLAAAEAQHAAEAEQRRRAEEAAVAAAHRAREAAQRWEQAEQQATSAEGELEKLGRDAYLCAGLPSLYEPYVVS